jgi:hypothetical protein
MGRTTPDRQANPRLISSSRDRFLRETLSSVPGSWPNRVRDGEPMRADACMAVLSAMVVVNEMHGYTEAGKRLPELNAQLVALQDERLGEAIIGKDFEIKTK